jgi:hypothetical protein
MIVFQLQGLRSIRRRRWIYRERVGKWETVLMTFHRYRQLQYFSHFRSALEIDIVRLSVYSYNTPNSK